jgi:PAS domain S-box-containing protein
LRARAEALLQERAEALRDPTELSPEEVGALLHELRVHEIELEMQNEALRDSLVRFHDLYEFAPVGYLTLDAEGLILHGNLTSVSLLDEERETFMGKPFTRYVSYEGQDPYYFFRRDLSRTGGPCSTELWMERADGSRFYAHLAGDRIAGAAELSEERYRLTITDLTELRQTQAEQETLMVSLEEQQVRTEALYQESEARKRLLDTILEEMPVGALIADAENTILSVNRMGQEILEQQMVESPQEMEVAYRVYSPDGTEVALEQLPLPCVLREQRAPQDEEFLLRWPDGHERWVLTGSTPLYDQQGQLVGAITIFQDITRQKQVEAELARSNTELQHFAEVVSHDLQQPLRTITSFLQLIKERSRDHIEGETQEFMDYVLEAAGRLQEMIQALLHYSRVRTRGRAFEMVDCEELLDYTVGSLQCMIAERSATITHTPLPRVQADARQLQQVFQNLITNAVKFQDLDTSPQVHITAERQEKVWRFAVQDNGIGIPDNQQERLFQVFQRFNPEYPGTGIGLALCKRIVERHGGCIWVASRVGEGSTFYFTLPVVPHGSE